MSIYYAYFVPRGTFVFYFLNNLFTCHEIREVTPLSIIIKTLFHVEQVRMI